MSKSGREPKRRQLLLSCEHATNKVPAKFQKLFADDPRVLSSHRGWDPGTLELGKRLDREFGTGLHLGQVSRLLVELNRSLNHQRLFSEFSEPLPDAEREILIQKYWKPYREKIQEEIKSRIRRGENVIHISLHSFTPVYDGVAREVDIGLLFDPKRRAEVAAANRWIADLKKRLPDFRVRRNYPYRGTSDGLTTSLRNFFPGKNYAGIELEISQKFPLGPKVKWIDLQKKLVDSIRFLTSLDS